MKRKTTVSAYVAALVISIIIFSAGILIGIQLNSQSATELERGLESLKNKAYALEIISLMNNETSLCKFYEQQVKEFDRETSEFGFKLTYLENSKRSDPVVLKLKGEYSLMEVRDYLLLQKINSVCGRKFELVLYFYSNKNCSRCGEQGNIITEIKKTNPDEIMVYSFDRDLENTAIAALVSIYEVKSVPAVVINGKKLNGFQSKEALMKAIAGS